MDLIYCAGGNTKLAKIAIEEGFLYGSRSDDIRDIHCNGLIDIKWESYDWNNHVRKVEVHRPKYAVVPDILSECQLSQALSKAEELEPYCSKVIIVPKVHGIISQIPDKYVIGISIVTRYSGFRLNDKELIGRRIHLLGGTPNQQKAIWYRLNNVQAVVKSLDCNSHILVSNFGKFWDGEKWRKENNGEYLGKYESFRKSCQGIMNMWNKLNQGDIESA